MTWAFWIGLALLALWFVDEYWPRTPEQVYQRRLMDLYGDMRRRGLSSEEMQAEFRFRHAMARLRRKATERVIAEKAAVLRDYCRARDIIVEIASAEAGTLNRSEKRKFMDVARGPASDILYRDAMKIVDESGRRMVSKKVTITSDDIAAVTTIR